MSIIDTVKGAVSTGKNTVSKVKNAASTASNAASSVVGAVSDVTNLAGNSAKAAYNVASALSSGDLKGAASAFKGASDPSGMRKVANKYNLARINQEGERAFTVRPRYYATDPDNPKRGEAASIRIITPKKNLESSEIAAMVKSGARHEQAAATKMLATGYQEFLVTDINYGLQEKHQVFQTFGGRDAVYFYGKAPMMVQVGGILFDDLDNDQFAKMASTYTNHLRGTRLAKNYSIVELSLPNAVFFGAITAINFAQTSDRDTDVRFSMTMIVRDVIFRSTDTYFTDDSGNVVDYQNENFLKSADVTITQAVINAKSADAKAVIRGTVAGTSSKGNSSLDVSGIYQNGVDIIPSVADLLGGFSVDDLTKFFTTWNNKLGEILNVVTSFADDVNSFVNEAVAYIGAIEAGIDGFFSTISNAVSQVEGMIDNIKDAYGTVVNFPETLANKIGRFINNGFIEPAGASIVGSRSVSAADAEALLRVLARNDPGPIRGTDLAEKAVNKNSDDVAIIDAKDV